MEIYTKITDVTKKYRNVAVALGMFDGMHIGHQSIVRRAAELAKRANGASAVFTFSNHPLSVLAPDSLPPMIGGNELKIAVFEKMGVDVLFNVPFTREFSRIAPEKFLAMLKNSLAPKFVVTGANYTFGYMGKGNPRMLLRLAEEYGFTAEICPTILRDGRAVSSTRIRELLKNGELHEANDFLGHPFSFAGRVVHGDRRGRTLGFPTANLKIEASRAMLPNGAYAAEVFIGEKNFDALVNIGSNPTFGGREKRLEANLQNFDADIYGEFIEVGFLEKLRGEKKFADADELVRQLRRDREKAAKIWEKNSWRQSLTSL